MDKVSSSIRKFTIAQIDDDKEKSNKCMYSNEGYGKKTDK